jgi:hypothetical protein
MTPAVPPGEFCFISARFVSDPRSIAKLLDANREVKRNRRGGRRPLAPAGPPRDTRGMGQEHDDYADRDLPPPRRLSWDLISVLLGIGLFLFIIVAVLLAAVANGPQFSD